MEKIEIKHSRRRQLDKAFNELKKFALPALPKNGWIAEVRTLLQMTSSQLAQRVGVSQPVISLFEKSERQKKITLKSLEKIASALECDLYYVLIPKKGLEQELFDRAEKKYEENVKQTAQHMILEDQLEAPAESRLETPLETSRRVYEILKLYGKAWEKE